MIEPLNKNRGAAICALRKWETQAGFAKRYGCNRMTVSNWEKGKPIARRFWKQLIEEGLDPAYVLPTAPAATEARADLSSRGAA
jgi:transcriptional regulator with XRE-family HTH domain